MPVVAIIAHRDGIEAAGAMNYPGFNEALNRYHTLRSMHSDARTYSGNRG